MFRTSIAAAITLAAVSVFAPPAAVAADAQLVKAIASPTRTAEYRERDRYRHPEKTLEFFGIKPEQTVVEIWPSSGWYTEILAPYLRDHGKYYAAGAAASLPNASEGTKKSVAAFKAKLDADPTRFDKVVTTEFRPPSLTAICPPGTADLVLTFRNVHNWILAGFEQDAFNSFYKALKPGGTLGVVEHRAKPDTTLQQTKDSGYTNESYIRTLATNAGFRFVGSSPVNDNAKDTKDYPKGVWTLPPVLTEGDKDREKYLAIGESDRMTLKFVKPR